MVAETKLNMNRRAKVMDPGCLYSTYQSFAIKLGYPNAAVKSDSYDDRRELQKGEMVRLLANGQHEWYKEEKTLWIIENDIGEQFIIGEDGLKFIDEQPTQDKFMELISNLSAEVVRLTKRMDGLDSKLTEHCMKLAENISGVHADVNKLSGADYQLQYPQHKPKVYTREQVIEEAKEFVKRLEHTYPTLKFFVNRDKRTVAAIIKDSRYVLSRGIAKTHVDDVFNSWIGKYIAACRCLGYSIPPHFTDAPQPTGVKVGDIVRWFDGGNTYRYKETRFRKFTGQEMHDFEKLNSPHTFSTYSKECENTPKVGVDLIIIDDTGEEV